MKQWMNLAKNLMMTTQFGFSLVTPLLLCIGLCWLLTAKAGAGGWVYLPGFLFGLGGSGMTAWKLYLAETKRDKKKEQESQRGCSFNTHE